MDWTLEVVVLPVSDIDRATEFYRDRVGFHLDHDTKNEHMHVVQLTPNGSGCSIVFGDLPPQWEMEPGSMKGLQLCVPDAKAARQELLDRGVDAGDIMCSARTTAARSSASRIRTATRGQCRSCACGPRSPSSHPTRADASAPRGDELGGASREGRPQATTSRASRASCTSRRV